MNRSLLHSLILPVLFYSSSVGEIKNPDPERFSASFNKFSEQDLKNKRQGSGLTLFTGSSSIRRWDTLQMDFPHLHLLNRGFGGAHISDVLYFYDELFIRYKPTRVVFYCGENDLWSGKPVSQVMKDFLALWAKIEKDLPECSLLYLSCKPSPKRISKWNTYQALNLRIKNFCLRKGRLTYVDLSPTLLKPNFTFNPKQWDPDQLHVNPAGYQSWTHWLQPLLAEKN
jgi:lysophospholipase L1-like esterase